MLVQLYRMRGTYHPLWEKGHLLASGGASEQPARYVETMYALDALAATSRRRYAEIKYPTTTPPTRED